LIVSALKCIKTVVACGLFTTIVCCSQHVEILTNFVSARHKSNCFIFELFAKYRGRRRNEKKYRQDCFSGGRNQNSFIERIIYHNCLLLTTRRNIDELCIVTSSGEMSDFRTFRQVRRSTSSKRKQVSDRLFQR